MFGAGRSRDMYVHGNQDQQVLIKYTAPEPCIFLGIMYHELVRTWKSGRFAFSEVLRHRVVQFNPLQRRSAMWLGTRLGSRDDGNTAFGRH